MQLPSRACASGFQCLRAGLLGVLLLSLPIMAAAERPAPQNAEQPGVIKSPEDDRQYRYLTLDNGLRVLLISDAEADKAAASLDVFVGSAQNPRDREGLAHFLEHMLFLGTKKYPEPGEYQTFISANGGSHNAYTAAEHTNYFFDINAAKLEVALDRFSQFFVAPLFTRKYVERERHAVNSEYRAGLKDDFRRALDVYRELINLEHPLSKFSVGSLETLADRTPDGAPEDLVRDDLLDFYQRYYSAEIMTLVVLGREPLAQLEAMVRPRFAAIPAPQVPSLRHGKPMFAPGFLPAEVHIRPEQEQRRLTLVFPVPAEEAYFREQPLQYISNLLGHEGRGSLLSLLKERGWAEGLGAGAGISDRETALFTLSISLTPEGMKEKETLVALTLAMIKKVASRGVTEWRFDEQRQLGEIGFRFREKGAPASTVSQLAGALHRYPAADVLRGPFLFQRYDAGLIKKYLNYMRADNMLVALVSPTITPNKVSKLYQVPYKIAPRSGKPAKLSRRLKRQLRLPEANAFIPQRLQVSMTEASETKPQILRKSERLQIWYQQDTQFQVPKANLYVRVKTPLAAASAAGAAQMRLYAALVEDALNEFSYPALLAGLGLLVLIGLGYREISADKMTTAELVALLFYAVLMNQPLSQLANALNRLLIMLSASRKFSLRRSPRAKLAKLVVMRVLSEGR